MVSLFSKQNFFFALIYNIYPDLEHHILIWNTLKFWHRTPYSGIEHPILI